jgi:mxaJ protein
MAISCLQIRIRPATCTERADVRCFVAGLLLAAAVSAQATASPTRTLRVCADPNNAPFSSDETPGFENEIADVLAAELDARVEYTWWALRRGFFKNTLRAGSCDVVIGVPVGLGMVRTTAPYYRSSYVFVTRADRKLDLTSLDDPRLAKLKVGVQIVGDDGASSPPAHALARRGITNNVRGFSPYADYRERDPMAAIIRAVAEGEIDVAIAWGPLAGGYARASKTKLVIRPVAQHDDAGLPLTFAIAIGVRKDDTALAAELDKALLARRRDIDKILERWHVPRLPIEEAK